MPRARSLDAVLIYCRRPVLSVVRWGRMCRRYAGLHRCRVGDDAPYDPAMPLPDVDPSGRRIVVAGDWHGSLGWAVDVVERAHHHGAHLIVQLGDFGALWPGDGGRFERRLDARLARRDMQVLFIAGNHDVWPELVKLPLDDDGFGVLRSRIRYAPQGYRFRVGGRTFGVLAGAHSVDQDVRTAGVDWWPEEEPTQADVDRLGDAPLDVLLAHDAPLGAPLASELNLPPGHPADGPRELITQAVERTRPRLLLHGHWHQRASYTVAHAGGATRVEALGCDGDMTGGDAVLLDLEMLSVEPLPRRKQA